MRPQSDNTPYWTTSTEDPELPAVASLDDVDVAVLGAGIAGLTTAHLLRGSGLSVAVVEAGRLAAGVSGHTTAKITAQHGALYRSLASSFDENTARGYAADQTRALNWIERRSVELGVDCEFSRRDSVLYAEGTKAGTTLREEAEAEVLAGLAAEFTTDTGLPFPVGGAVRLRDQAQFHPRKWLLGLAATVPGDGSYLCTGVRAIGLTEGDPCVVHTTRGDLRARHVVVATHYPVFDRGLFFARLEPKQDMVVAGPVPAARAPRGMYYSSEDGHSIRTAPLNGDEVLLIVGGEGHRPGDRSSTEERYQRLAAWARERLGLTAVTHRWSDHDNSTADGLPYVGRYHPRTDRVWVATGFGHWGMTNGTLAGLLLHDLITGTTSGLGVSSGAAAKRYDPQRLTVRQSVPGVVRANASVGAHALRDELAAITAPGFADLAPGEGRVRTSGTRAVAAYREQDGTLCAVSARCTHLGCLVAFNDAERTWDCPCHGSRFGLDGSVLHGPAVTPLKQVDVHE
ncbi:FAD-dependent oxidoreductase [Umezawaea beigongshangensis]|uniref:FAD-dependent oxidoreductase n=1 Tax=Umezawaea beigongshangensis TaxID=2780383 RepID=UPI0018F24794|nr:FAD-dependent oxidoreductase [Umezawaea beigongshangensis]